MATYIKLSSIVVEIDSSVYCPNQLTVGFGCENQNKNEQSDQISGKRVRAPVEDSGDGEEYVYTGKAYSIIH